MKKGPASEEKESDADKKIIISEKNNFQFERKKGFFWQGNY